MNRLTRLATSRRLVLVVGLVAWMGAGCGSSGSGGPAEFDPEPLLVPWDQLSGRIAYVRGNNEIIVIDPTARTVRLVHRTGEYDWVKDVTWQPDGSALTVTLLTIHPATRWWLASVDVRTGNRTEVHPALLFPAFAAWSPDGRIAFTAAEPPDRHLFVDGVPLSPPLDLAFLTAPSWSPDGSTLAVVVYAQEAAWGFGDLGLVDVATGAVSPLGPADCAQPRFSPDGTRVAYRYLPVEPGPAPMGRSQLRVAGVPGGVETPLSGADGIHPSHPDWSPDGAQLVVQGDADVVHPKLYLVNASTGVPTQLTAKDGHSPAWIP